MMLIIIVTHEYLSTFIVLSYVPNASFLCRDSRGSVHLASCPCAARPARLVQEEPRFDGLGFHTWTHSTYTLISLAYTSRVAPLKLSDRS